MQLTPEQIKRLTPEGRKEFLRASQERVMLIARQREEEAEAKREIYLPEWYGNRRGTPNAFIRSALFSAIQGKDRVFLDNATLFSQEGYSINFTGKQLNQEDLTVWETLVHLARLSKLGNTCFFTAYEILAMMNLSDGKENYKSLQGSIDRLTGCLVKVFNQRNVYGGSLIDGFEIDEVTKKFEITLNRKLIKLFEGENWTAIDWQQRLQLRSKSLAQALHAYYSSHRDPYPVKLSTIQALTGSKNKQAASFKRQCRMALDELVEIGFLKNYEIKKDLISVERIF
jgi:TrfA protein